jgi:Zn-dependent M28 family amino/carboxypeptidase
MRFLRRHSTTVYLSVIAVFLLGVGAWYGAAFDAGGAQTQDFDGARAYADLKTQVDFGPRIPGSEGHARTRAWIRSQLVAAGWTVTVQTSTQMGHPVANLVAARGDRPPEILLGAHYDTRILADQDPDASLRAQPVPGANDGGSGVAVLLELARTLPADTPPVWLVFFDAEDNGRIDGWDWLLGSRAFVAANPVTPRAVVVLDMIGDSDLNLYFEQNSDPALREQIWAVAARLGYDGAFIARPKHSLLDDHIPFLEAGIPAVDIIDFDYPYWHTTQDTVDKTSAESLGVVGSTLQAWIIGQNHQ